MSETASINIAVEEGKASESSPRITVQKRAPGTQQLIKDAAAYILRFSATSPGVLSHPLHSTILAELRAHFAVLRAHSASVTLILALRLLPEPGTVDPDIEAIARVQDLCQMQLANEHETEMQELVELVNSVQDSRGWLTVANKFGSGSSTTVALSIKYQPYADRHHEAEPTVLR